MLVANDMSYDKKRAWQHFSCTQAVPTFKSSSAFGEQMLGVSVAMLVQQRILMLVLTMLC